MSAVPALVAHTADGPLVPGTVERREPGPYDVVIDIQWAGICHSDIHTVRGEWGPVPYPLTVGHEIAGVVSAVGAKVTRHRVGDRVGVGCMVNSCRECDACRAGFEQHCEKGMIGTYGAPDRDGTITQGGYASSIVVTEDFVLSIPDGLDFSKTAPLLCAGITTYSPLKHWGVGAGSKVAVVGMGGLGHMAVKIAHAMGAEVTVLSQTLSKREDGLAMGASAYYATSDPATFETLHAEFDLILNTVSASVDLNAFLRMLRFDGALVTVGVAEKPMSIDTMTLFVNRRKVAGSMIGGIAETQEMLEFCATHQITPEVEFISAEQINEAWENVLASKVRYRYVIDTSTLASA
ncbi:NAD(P)-dependent alcohol dehydrogenase [Nesterenkonia flava]|uniref:alcohol dehydrogenase (NADP(+)) n=1 Tax=Nesterenkonia flava TaxID=469799 RepID=A0ABU1FW53_9MICC|nr:NAD(P)-dependent alcohol dehydrogenase [Nesterenkonia flava]MDR5712910.1 NAD(P)-dependent alcohol dehydrogenase [Nesterenkonia flava]